MFAVFAMLIFVNAATANPNFHAHCLELVIRADDIIAMPEIISNAVNNGFDNVSVDCIIE